jgi:hypothetical protein
MVATPGNAQNVGMANFTSNHRERAGLLGVGITQNASLQGQYQVTQTKQQSGYLVMIMEIKYF